MNDDDEEEEEQEEEEEDDEEQEDEEEDEEEEQKKEEEEEEYLLHRGQRIGLRVELRQPHLTIIKIWQKNTLERGRKYEKYKSFSIGSHT